MTRPEPRADLRALAGYHSPQLDVTVRLNTNESPFPPPTAFVDAWIEAIRSTDLNRYPDRSAHELRVGIGGTLHQPATRIFAANGSNEVLQTLLLTYGGPGRRALVFEPTYALHSHIARITGTGVITGHRNDQYGIDLPNALGLIATEQPDIVFVCSPNNPSGTVEPLATIAAIADAASGLVIVDEAYGEFAPESALSLIDGERALVVTRTYSKVWSLAALRLGFAVAPEWVIAELDKVVLPYHLDAATQLAGRAALDFVAEMEGRVRHIVEERERISAALKHEPLVEVFPSGANFLLFRCVRGGRAVWDGLVARGVLVRDFSSWPGVEDCLRVTVGSPDENDAFLSSLHVVLRESTDHG